MDTKNERTVVFLDSSFNPAAICEDVIFLEYSEQFCGAGELDCELIPPAGFEPETNTFVGCGDGLIFAVERTKRNGSSGTFEIHGRGILSLFSRRIVPRSFAFTVSPELCAKNILETYGAAALPLPLAVRCDSYGAACPIVVEAGDALERAVFVLSSVAKGLRLTHDAVNSRFVLDVFAGVDRRLPNVDENEPVFLSEGFGTVCGVSEVVDRSQYFNRVTVRGSENAEGRAYTVTVDASDYAFPDGFDDSGEPVCEGYVKCAVGVSLYTNDGVFDGEGYFAALRERGREELSRRRVRRTLVAQYIGDEKSAPGVGDLCTLDSVSSAASTVKLTKRTFRFRGGEQSVILEFAAL